MLFAIYILVGFACGFVDGSLGMGYGVTTASVLISFGINPAVASASIHASEGVVDIVSAFSQLLPGLKQIRDKIFDKNLLVRYSFAEQCNFKIIIDEEAYCKVHFIICRHIKVERV